MVLINTARELRRALENVDLGLTLAYREGERAAYRILLLDCEDKAHEVICFCDDVQELQQELRASMEDLETLIQRAKTIISERDERRWKGYDEPKGNR